MRFGNVLLVVSAVACFCAGCGTDSKQKQEAQVEAVARESVQPSQTESPVTDEPTEESPNVDGLPMYATGPVAVVNGEEIPAVDFNAAVRRLEPTSAKVSVRQLETIRDRIVTRLIDDAILKQVAAPIAAEVTPAEVDAEFERFRDNFVDDGLQSFYQRVGLTEETLRKELVWAIAAKKLLRRGYGASVTDAEVKAYYDENIEAFRNKQEVRARHILFKVSKTATVDEVARAKARAKKVSDQAKKPGADFGALAREYSEGPTANRGGDLGYFERERMVPRFAEAAFGMEAGEVSDPVKTAFGYHVIKVEDVREPGLRPFEDAAEEIREELETRKLRNSMAEFMEQRREAADIVQIESNVQIAN